nr:iron-containing alcohol dehydrogenase [Petrotogaceae bacterium]
MENFVFSNPTCLIFGKDTIKRIGKEIKKRGVKNVLLLYGSGSIFKNGVYDAAVKSLKDNEVGFVQLGGIKPNPVLSKVYEGIKTAMK